MNRFSAAAVFVLAFLSFDSRALTLQPLPGTTPQATCFSCVFPNEIGVTARDASGQPVANVPVTFTTQSNTLGLVRYDDFCCVAWGFITVPTGSDGIARATAITIYHDSSAGIITASAPGAANAVFNLSSTAVRATSVDFVSGWDQYAQSGTTFAAPWQARALDANGQPVPRTMLAFYAGDYGSGESTATFNGADRWAFAVAGADGVATSPIARADGVGSGTGYIQAATKAVRDGEFAPFTRVPFHVVSQPITSITLQALPGTTPQATCFSCVFPNEIGVIARDASGQPAPNVPVTFTSQANTLGMVHFDDFCCVAHDAITVTTGPDGTARATAITLWHTSSTGVVTASVPGAADAIFNLSSTEQRATKVEFVDPRLRIVQVGTNFDSPWKIRVLDASGQPVPRTMVTFYVGNFGGEQARASFNGGAEWAFAVADANGVAVSPIAHSETLGTGEGWVEGAIKAPVEGEVVARALEQYVAVTYPITSRSATLVGMPPDSVQLNSVAAAPYPVRVLDASGAPAVGMPVYFMTEELNQEEPRCMSFFAEGSGEELIYSDANGIATPSVLYGDIPGSCTLKIWVPGVAEPIVREVWVFDPANVVAKPRHEWVTSDTGHKYRVTLDFTEFGRKVQPGAIEWIEVKRYAPGLRAGYTGEPKYTFANNSAIIELRANQYPGLYDLDIAYTVTNHARVHVLQLP